MNEFDYTPASFEDTSLSPQEFIERKALNRTIHTLAADPRLPIRQDQKSGVWYEQ